MITSIQDSTTLYNGIKMPWLGLGVWKMEDGSEVEQAVQSALKIGYRSIDTAAYYLNEIGVGKAILESGVPRDEIFVTTKVWNDSQGYETTLSAFQRSQKKLGLDYIDLYLIHWPVKEQYLKTWKALEKLYTEGLVRAIGVSNFQIHHLKDVMDNFEITPMVNQVELHPYFSQEDLRKFCIEHNIQIQAWSPLMQGKIITDSTICSLAKKYHKSPVQIVLRWNIQHSVVTIPKSSNIHRMIENANIFDFELSSDDMKTMDVLNKNTRTGPDPDNFDF